MAVVVPGKFIYLATPFTGSMATAYTLKRLPGALVPTDKMRGIGHHATLEEVRQVVGDRLVGNEHVFTFVRNPYDLLVTWWLREQHQFQVRALERKLNRPPTMLEFIKLWDEARPFPYFKDGDMFYQTRRAQTVLRYERGITREINSVMRKLGGVSSVEIGHQNVTEGKDHWSMYYDEETYGFVNEAFRDDFVKFGYQFLRA
jgi:hypothetical protein